MGARGGHGSYADVPGEVSEQSPMPTVSAPRRMRIRRLTRLLQLRYQTNQTCPFCSTLRLPSRTGRCRAPGCSALSATRCTAVTLRPKGPRRPTSRELGLSSTHYPHDWKGWSCRLAEHTPGLAYVRRRQLSATALRRPLGKTAFSRALANL